MITAIQDNKPVYLQLADVLMDDIVSRKYTDDGRVPSVREFAADHQVNVNTVARTYEYLTQRDIIYTRRGMGYFVWSGAAARVAEMRRQEFLNHDMGYFFGIMRSFGMTPDELSNLYKEYLSKIN